MLPLNPFLGAFFKSSLPAQCAQVHQYILLVPITEVLLTWQETETGAPAHELLTSEEFLGSHVLRIAAVAKDTTQNLRDLRGKARQYSTLNGRSVVIKDSFVYSNKGFKAPNEAQLLQDAVWYSDTLDWKQWLIYYISKPLIGTWKEVEIPIAILPVGVPKESRLAMNGASTSESSEGRPRKKDLKFFPDLLTNFPIIARHMGPGLERLFNEFNKAFERPLPPPPSANDIPDPEPDGPIRRAMKKARSNSTASATSSGQNGPGALPVSENFYAEDDEDVMRASLETAISAAIDMFQTVDKQQLSMLATTTDLTGPAVEKMIERHVAEHVHGLLFPRLCLLKRPYDMELEAKIRQMEFIDVSQLGIQMVGGAKGKHDLIIQLSNAVDEFRKMINAMSPQEMLELLVSTMKSVTKSTEYSEGETKAEDQDASEKPIMTVNADILVSLLLFVVIRAQIKNLQARLTYIRQFVVVEDTESGESGYALSTFEAVLAYLSVDSGGLRRASRRNKMLWNATSKGDLDEVKKILEPTSDAIDDEDDGLYAGASSSSIRSASSRRQSATWSVSHRSSRPSSLILTESERFSLGSGLGHVFPFQAHNAGGSNGEETGDHFTHAPVKRLKRVSMDTRSISGGSEYSFGSKATSFGSLGSTLEGDISAERLSQTHDGFGESVPMMAVQHGRAAVLRYLLSLPQYYPLPVILGDINNEDTTLLSAAVQLGNIEIISMLLEFIEKAATPAQMSQYFSAQDIWGRSVGHYLFHAPSLIPDIGKLVPWRQQDKNGQTPLFALCRSYDQDRYSAMVSAGLEAARRGQGDGEPLHVDDHVDAKGNTLLHVITDPHLAARVLHGCDVDVNATNEKRFTPLMLASKYGRYELVRVLYGDPRADLAARELRGLTAVELAKDDDVRNKIDDLALFSLPPPAGADEDPRITGVVRAFFVEDGTVRLVLKSAAPSVESGSHHHQRAISSSASSSSSAQTTTPAARSYTVTTCRRSLGDFEALASLLATESPWSWIPSTGSGPGTATGTAPDQQQRSPFQIPSRPSRAVLREIQHRADWFLRVLLAHPTFAAHETLWEFFLAPEMRLDAMTLRSHLKAEALEERIRDELEPVKDVREVEQFVDHAREMIRSVSHSIKSVTRRTNRVAVAALDLSDATNLLHRVVDTLEFLSPAHQSAWETYVRTMVPPQSNPYAALHAALMAQLGTTTALLSALSRPPHLVAQIKMAQRTMERTLNSLARPPSNRSRWGPSLVAGFLGGGGGGGGGSNSGADNDASGGGTTAGGSNSNNKEQRAAEERSARARKARDEVDGLARRLRHAQQVVAGELAGWQDLHARMGRRAVREFAQGVLVQERVRLAGLMRALRRVRTDGGDGGGAVGGGRSEEGTATSSSSSAGVTDLDGSPGPSGESSSTQGMPAESAVTSSAAAAASAAAATASSSRAKGLAPPLGLPPSAVDSSLPTDGAPSRTG